MAYHRPHALRMSVENALASVERKITVAHEIECIPAVIDLVRHRYGDFMTQTNDYDDIPGTYVYDSERGRIGYALNMFCMSLNKAENRKAFKENAAAYLDRYKLTAEQRRAVLERDWLGMLKVGGNIYYTIKIAFCDGLTFQDVAGMMSGVSKETYAQMMLAGGRSPDGNRYKATANAAEKQ